MIVKSYCNLGSKFKRHSSSGSGFNQRSFLQKGLGDYKGIHLALEM
jgi:hypothetical protein